MEQDYQKKWYDNTLIVILLLVVFFPVGLYALWKNKKIAIGWKIAGSLFIFIVVISAINNDNNPSNNLKSDTDSTTNVVDTIATPTEPVYKWVYSEQTNEMDDSKTLYAQIDADEKLNFKFPYGEETATLTIRNKSKQNEVILSITNGQFLSNLMDNRHIVIRFDEDKSRNYSYNDPSDGSSTAIFINDPVRFIKRLKTSKTLLIQCEFYQEGNVTMKFQTDGLKWEH